MPLWIGIGSLVLGGVGAINQHRAAGRAADQQVAASQQGLDLQRQIYDEQKAGMQPYAAFGQQALGNLGALMGFPALQPGAGGVLGAPIPVQTPGAVNPMSPEQMAQMPRPMLTNPNGPSAAQQQQGQAFQSTYGSQRPTGSTLGTMTGQMVTLQAPDGEVRQVPAAQAGHFEQAGARRL